MSRYLGITLTLGLCVAMAGCHPSWEHWHRQNWSWEDKIEKFDKYRRDFGEISVSPPIVVTDPSQFSLKFNKSAEQLYAEAGKPQVVASTGRFDVTSFQGSVGVQAESVPAGTATPFAAQAVTGLMQTILDNAGADPDADADADPQIALDLLNTLLGVAQPATEPTAVPAREPMAVPGLPSNPASDRLKQLSDAANVLGPLQADVSASPFAKATEAANAHYHMKLFELFSDPTRFSLAPDEKPMLFAGSITVSPGRVTEKHFLAEIAMRLKVIDNKEKAHTVDVVSAFPSIVGQTMDLQSLVAMQRDFAGQLQAAGFGAAANALFSTSSASQSNARSLNQRVTISAFNRKSTGHVGWRVRGEYWAYDPNNTDALRPDLRVGGLEGPMLPWKIWGTELEPGSVVLMQDVTIPVVMVGLVPVDLWKWVKLAQEAAQLCKQASEMCDKYIALFEKTPELEAEKETRSKLPKELNDTIENAIRLLEPFEKAGALREWHATAIDEKQWRGFDDKENQETENVRLLAKLEMARRCKLVAGKDARTLLERIRFEVTTRWVPADKWGRKVSYPIYKELHLVEGLYRAEVATRLELDMKGDILNKRPPGVRTALVGANGDSYKRFVDAWGEGAWRSVVGPGISAFQIKVPVPAMPLEPSISAVRLDATSIKIPKEEQSTQNSDGKSTETVAIKEVENVSTRRTTILVVEGKHFGKSPRFICAGLDARTLGVFKDGTVALVEVNPALIKSGETLTGALVVVTKGGYAESTETISFMTKKGSKSATPQTTLTIDKNYKPKKDSEPKTRITVEEKGGGAKAEVFKALHHCTDILCTICNPGGSDE